MALDWFWLLLKADLKKNQTEKCDCSSTCSSFFPQKKNRIHFFLPNIEFYEHIKLWEHEKNLEFISRETNPELFDNYSIIQKWFLLERELGAKLFHAILQYLNATLSCTISMQFNSWSTVNCYKKMKNDWEHSRRSLA